MAEPVSEIAEVKPVVEESTPPTPPPAQAPEPNPLDAQNAAVEGNSGLVQNVLKTEGAEDKGPMLEAVPEIDMSLIQEFAPQKSILLLAIKVLLGLFVTLGIASVLFFSSQLSDAFNIVTTKVDIPNASNQLQATNDTLVKLQTELNLYNFLQIKEYLDEFSFLGDGYLINYEVSNSQTATSSEKRAAGVEMDYSRTEMKAIFESLSGLVVAPTSTNLVNAGVDGEVERASLFRSELIASLNIEATGLGESSDPAAKTEQKNFRQTIALVNNVELKNFFVNLDFDALDEKGLRDSILTLNGLVVNDLSVIQEIKARRIKWSDIINEIELRTLAVDGYHGSSQYDTLGGIRYTSYDFDAEANRITIIGETKRFDTTNFTVISNLIDEINSSTLFRGADMRTFSKSGSDDDGYTARLRLSMELQGSDEIDAEDTVSLEEYPSALKEVKEITR